MHAIAVRQVLVVGVADDDVAARVVDVAGDGPKGVDSVGGGSGVGGLVDLQAPLNGGVGSRAVHAGGLDDVLSVDPADLGGLLGRPLLDDLCKLLETVGPPLHEVVVVEVLLDEDVRHGHGQGGVGAGAHAQPHLGAGGQPREGRVDGDHLGTALHAVDDPMAEEVVGVGNNSVAAPVHDDLRTAPLGTFLVVAILELLRHIGDHEVAVHGSHGGRTRAEARVACKIAHGEVRGAERRMCQIGDLVAVVAAGADVADDGLGTVVLPDGADLLLDDVEGLVPADLLPLVLAALAGALHGMAQARRVVDELRHFEAAHAQRALVKRVLRVALDLLELAVLGVVKHAAAVMAAGARPGGRAGDGVLAVLPLDFPLVLLVVVKFHNYPLSSVLSLFRKEGSKCPPLWLT